MLSSIDLSLTEHANAFATHHDRLEDLAKLYAAISEPLFIVLCAALVVGGLVLRRTALTVAGLSAVIAAGVALAVTHVVSLAVDRPRPFVAHPGQIHPFLHHAADAGFPSDHATAAFAIAGVLLIRLGRRWWPILAAAVLLAAARVMLGLHYPADVVAGAGVGLLAAMIVCAAVRRYAARGIPRLAPRSAA
jgi:membrane-associated phospholipid phosphatase